ncbi:hypothetical protein E8E15_002441 [Penicillium rubens]|nr:hypothetical protein E8E15_002441 [Penicillium rubens]
MTVRNNQIRAFRPIYTQRKNHGALSRLFSPGLDLQYIKPLTAHQGESEPAPPSVLRAKPAYTPFLVLPLACPLWNIATQGCGPKTGRISSERSFFMGHYVALHPVFRPRPHRLRTLNGCVSQPLAVYTKRSPNMTVQFLVICGFVTGLCRLANFPGASSAASSNRQPESATNLNTTGHEW